MKVIGLIGGIDWESTVTYYKLINETIKKQLGGFHSAKILLYSVDFDEIEKHQSNDEWDKSAELLADIAKRLEIAGADFIVICTNTMHKVAAKIQKHISVPIIHIAEATAETLAENGIQKVGLLGTKYTMTQDFFKGKITDTGVDIIVPDEPDIETINAVIYNELCNGMVKGSSRTKFLEIIDNLAKRGAEGVILGCTEIGLLVRQEDTNIPIFDTTLIHARKAALLSIQ